MKLMFSRHLCLLLKYELSHLLGLIWRISHKNSSIDFSVVVQYWTWDFPWLNGIAPPFQSKLGVEYCFQCWKLHLVAKFCLGSVHNGEGSLNLCVGDGDGEHPQHALGQFFVFPLPVDLFVIDRKPELVSGLTLGSVLSECVHLWKVKTSIHI